MPGTWLTYLLVIGLPYSAAVVRPLRDDTRTQHLLPAYECEATSGSEGSPGCRSDSDRRKPPAVVDTNPIELVPPLPEEQFSLPEAFGRLMDVSLLPNKALRRVANSWTTKLGSCRTAAQVCEGKRPNLASRLAGVSVHDTSEDDGIGRCGSRAASPQRARLPVEYRHEQKKLCLLNIN
jgi:hypothetical protein